MMAKGTVKSDVIIHRTADEHINRVLVTIVMYCSECFMAMYRSTLISVRRNSDAVIKNRIAFFDHTVSKQFPFMVPATPAIKSGCPITPIIPSVVAKQLSAMFDMV